MEQLNSLWLNTGLYQMVWGQGLMLLIGILLLYLAIVKKFEPLLLLPIGFGAILANIPGAGIAEGSGILHVFYVVGIESGAFPLIIFMGVGALTDFGPLLANPKTLLLGAAAQFGIFATLLGAMGLTAIGVFDFSLTDAAAIGIIGGADGPTSIYVASKLAPELLGITAVIAYSYMAAIGFIQPPLMRLLTTKSERKIEMKPARDVSKLEKIVFPCLAMIIVILVVPRAAPLISMLIIGNLFKESGVVPRLSSAASNELLNIATIFLMITVGTQLTADTVFKLDTIIILVLGLVAFMFGTIGGLLFAKIMNLFLKDKINPLIGSAGVSAVPMAARLSHHIGQENNPKNYLLSHAMGPNVAGVIGSAVVAGVFVSLSKGF